MKLVIAGGKTVSLGRLNYIVHGYVAPVERELNQINPDETSDREAKKGRRLFNQEKETLTAGEATEFLKSKDAKTDGDYFEFYVSLREGEFEKLGQNLNEQTNNFRNGIADGLEKLWKEFNVSQAQAVFGIHLNTKNPHAHILVNKNMLDLDGNPKRVNTIPAEWRKEKTDTSSKIAALFEKSLEVYTGQIPPPSVVTIYSEKTGMNPAHFPAPLDIFNDRQSPQAAAILNSLSEDKHISPMWIEELNNNGSFYISKRGALVFIRRDMDGVATSFTGEAGWTARDDGKGFFYIGNPKTANKFLLVETPKEALALLELIGHRDLSEVCITSMDGTSAPSALTALLKERANESALRVIWAAGLNRNYRQEVTHFESLKEEIRSASNGERKLEFLNYAPKAGYGNTWQQQLISREIPGELEATIYNREIFQIEAEQIDSIESIDDNIENSVLYKNLSVTREKDEFIILTKDSGSEVGRYVIDDNKIPPSFIIKSIADENRDNLLFTSEEELLVYAANDWVNVIAQKAIEKLESDEREERRNDEIPHKVSETIPGRPAAYNTDPENTESCDRAQQNEKSIRFKVHDLPLEDVARELGLTKVFDREKAEYVFRDANKNFKIKITNEVFSDRYQDRRGGRGVNKLVRHVLNCDKESATSWLVANCAHLVTSDAAQKTSSLNTRPAAERSQSQTSAPKVLKWPSENPDYLDIVRTYLIRERAIAPDLVENLIERGDLRATTYKSALFVHRDPDGKITGGNWRATKGTKRADVPGTDKKSGWFYLGNFKNATKIVLTESPIEALSYVDINRGHLDPATTAVISCDGNSVPVELLNYINEKGADTEIVLAFNNDDGGERADLYTYEKLNYLSLLNHKAIILSGELERVNFKGRLTIAKPLALDWNDELKAIRSDEMQEADQEHIEAETDEHDLELEKLHEQSQPVIETKNSTIAGNDDLSNPEKKLKPGRSKKVKAEEVLENTVRDTFIKSYSEKFAGTPVNLRENESGFNLLKSISANELLSLETDIEAKDLWTLTEEIEKSPELHGQVKATALEYLDNLLPAPERAFEKFWRDVDIDTLKSYTSSFGGISINDQLESIARNVVTQYFENLDQIPAQTVSLPAKDKNQIPVETLEIKESDATLAQTVTGVNISSEPEMQSEKLSTVYNNLGSETLTVWYQNEADYEQREISGTVDSIKLNFSPDRQYKFYRITVETPEFQYFFAFGNRDIDKNSKEIFDAIEQGKFKKSDLVSFNGFVNKSIEDTYRARQNDGKMRENNKRGVPSYALEVTHYDYLQAELNTGLELTGASENSEINPANPESAAGNSIVTSEEKAAVIKPEKTSIRAGVKYGSRVIPDAVLNTIPFERQETSGNDNQIYAKIFHPLSDYTMFISEAEALHNDKGQIEDIIFFGYTHLSGQGEWGYSSLAEIESVKVGGLPVELDLYFKPGTFGDVIYQFKKERGLIDEPDLEESEATELLELFEQDRELEETLAGTGDGLIKVSEGEIFSYENVDFTVHRVHDDETGGVGVYWQVSQEETITADDLFRGGYIGKDIDPDVVGLIPETDESRESVTATELKRLSEDQIFKLDGLEYTVKNVSPNGDVKVIYAYRQYSQIDEKDLREMGFKTRQESFNKTTEEISLELEPDKTEASDRRFQLTQDTEPEGVKPGTISLAKEVRELLHAGQVIGNNIVFYKLAEKHFAGTRAGGAFSSREAYDALELGINLYLMDNAERFIKQPANQSLEEIRSILSKLPTQTDRTDEQNQFQQFSTPPTESYIAFMAAGIRPDDIVMEPSAGNAGLALWSKAIGTPTHVNELNPRRNGILKLIGFESVNKVDAQFINDLLPREIKPTVFIMNPPFSATAGRTATNKTSYGAEHITDALNRLEEGGRLVAIMGEGIALDKPKFMPWWSEIAEKYNVRTNISVYGEEYMKYGTNFGNQLLIIDKTGPTPGDTLQDKFGGIISGRFETLEEILEVVKPIGDERQNLTWGAKASETHETETGKIELKRILITWSESPWILDDSEFETASGFNKFIVETSKPDNPALYYKTDFQVELTDGTIFTGQTDIGQNSMETIEQILHLERVSAQTLLKMAENGEIANFDAKEKTGLMLRISKAERIISAIREFNELPPIDHALYEAAMIGQNEYDPNEADNFMPEEVRADYIDETIALASSVKYLTDMTHPITAGYRLPEVEDKNNLKQLENDSRNLSFHVSRLGTHFGAATEIFVRDKLEKEGIRFDEDYKITIEDDSWKYEPPPFPDEMLYSTPPKSWDDGDLKENKILIETNLDKENENDKNNDENTPANSLGRDTEDNLGAQRGAAGRSEAANSTDELPAGNEFGNAVVYSDEHGRGKRREQTDSYESPTLFPLFDTGIELAADIGAENGFSRSNQDDTGTGELIQAVKEEVQISVSRDDLKDVISLERNTERRENVGDGSVKYKPAKLTGGVDHPGDIVESASMAAVETPDITYTPQLPKEILEEGKLSNLQYETVCYAGQRHNMFLPTGERAGFFLGDGTGVGKGRQLAAIAIDNWNQGHKRILWLSINYDLVPSTERDMKDLGAQNIPLATWDKHKVQADLNETVGDAVLFGSYSTLTGKGADGKERFDQIIDWLGEDGVILFDEGHLAKNAISMGLQKSSQRGEKVVDLQIGDKSNKNWRFIYSSATGATEVRNFGYMQRLGLWGEGTGFPGGFSEFENAIDKGGVGAMEMVARDMKAAGFYCSRSLSFRGVDYTQVHHELTPEQVEIYDLASRAWSQVVISFGDSLTMNKADSRERAFAFARLYSSQQIFYRQLMTALKVPTVIAYAEKQLEEGSTFTDPQTGETRQVPAQVVLGIIGTGEARAKAQVAKATELGLDLDTLDFSPKQILLNLIEKSFPTRRFIEKMSGDGKTTIKVPLLDDEGRPVESLQAIKMRDALLTELNEKLTLPENPLDQIINYFGETAVAEITGRDRRLVIDSNTGEKTYAKRAREGVAMDKASQDEMSAFQAGRKRLAIISQSASTGISLHAELKPLLAQYVTEGRISKEEANYIQNVWNEENDFEKTRNLLLENGLDLYRRVHITVETAWSADTQLQTFGRTHRSNELLPPEYVLLSTNLGGEKRFLATIAKRLSSLGALTKGDRDQSGGGDLTKYDFENSYGEAAARSVIRMMDRGRGPVIDKLKAIHGENKFNTLELLYTIGIAKKKEGIISVPDKIYEQLEVSTFLNRVLMLEVSSQNAVFDTFVEEMERIIEKEKQLGLFDEGVRDIQGANIRFDQEPKIVSEQRATGAKTIYYKLLADTPTQYVTLEEIKSRNEVVRINGYEVADRELNEGKFYQQVNSKNIIYAEYLNTRIDAKTGQFENYYKFARPNGWQSTFISKTELSDKYREVKLDSTIEFKDDTYMKAADWWNSE